MEARRGYIEVRLGWMDGVKVASGSRKGCSKGSKDRKKWRALVQM